MLERLTDIHPLALPVAGVATLLALALLVDFVAKHIVLKAARGVAARTRTTWDDELVKHKVFSRLVHVVPALLIFSGIAFVPEVPEEFARLVRNLAMGYMVLMLTMAVVASLSAVHAIYARSEVARDRPLKGFVQLLQIVVWILGLLMIISAVLDRSPILLLSGVGAMTAIVLLIFKDTILSLVASVQLTAQDMVRVGDWIEMPQFGADGDVVDVQLHTVKVQNWDKTITTIPTHRLISDSFKNWRGMSRSGGRRIKRALHIDLSSIRFQTGEEVEHFKRFTLLKDYIDDKFAALAEYNSDVAVDADVNRRRLTNVGTFRAYALNYLRNHPSIHKDMTLLVRHLQPGPQGLPIELYCFTNTTAWGAYEGIQSDVFDHLIAILPEFGLAPFQEPTGLDVTSLRGPKPKEGQRESDISQSS
ncbi:MAG: mechanosensitive ion channel domain-containing protein [Pseudomonadota bacterium]